MASTSTSVTATITDPHIAEAVSRQCGYEVVEQEDKWGVIAGALGKKKSHGPMIKQRHPLRVEQGG